MENWCACANVRAYVCVRTCAYVCVRACVCANLCNLCTYHVHTYSALIDSNISSFRDFLFLFLGAVAVELRRSLRVFFFFCTFGVITV